MHTLPSLNRIMRFTALAGLGLAGLVILGLASLGLWQESYGFIAELEGLAWKAIGMNSVPLLALLMLNAGAVWYFSGFCRARGFRLAGAILAALLAGDLLAINYLPFLQEALSSIATLSGAPLAFGIGLGVAVLPCLMLATLNALLPSWRMILTGYVIVAGLCLYLAWDDAPLVAPRTMAQLSPEFPGAKESYEVWMRYGRKHPAGRDFKSADRIYRGRARFADVSQPAAWTNWLQQQRPAIEADWAELLPVHQWVQELDRFERIGDLTPVGPDPEMIAFTPMRAYSKHCCAVAGLLALDHKGDDAIALILPSLRVSRKRDA